MSEEAAPFCVGIDLGTTNCALAFAEGEQAPGGMAVPQVIAPGEVAE